MSKEQEVSSELVDFNPPVARGSERWKPLKSVGFGLALLPVWVGIWASTDSLMAQTGLYPENVARVLTDLSATFIGTYAIGTIIRPRIGIQ